MKKIVKKKKKSFFRKIVMFISIIFLLLLLGLFTVPYFFKDDIKTYINKEINEKLNATVEFKNIDISFFSEFPNLGTKITDILVKGLEEFKNDSLFYAKEINLEMDIWSLFSKKIEIVDFSIINPDINILILPDGRANYNIAKKDKSGQSEDKTDIKDIKLKHYAVVDANITYSDVKTNKRILISKLNHEGKGDFKDIVFALSTNTKIEEISFLSDKIAYLKKAKIDWDIDFIADLNNMRFDIKENILKLNDLNLVSKGQFQITEKYADIDFNLKAPGNNFKEIFSVIPNAFTKDYSKVQAKGNFSLYASIKGKLKFEEEGYPDFHVKINAADGFVKYPNMPLPIESINTNINIDKKGNSLNNTTIKINPLAFSIHDEKMQMSIEVKNLLSDPLSKGKFLGILNLDNLSKAFPIDDFKELTGKIKTDVKFKFNQSLTQQELAGFADIDNISVIYSEYPRININDAKIDFNTKKINIKELKLNAGKSDITGQIIVSNPLHYLAKNKTTDINIIGKSNLFDANEWINNEAGTDGEESKTDNSIYTFLKDRLSVSLKYEIDKLKYEDYDIENMIINGKYGKNELAIINQSLNLSGSNLNIKGKLNNILSWLMQNKTLNGTLSIFSPHFDLDKFMDEDSGNKDTKQKKELFSLPDKMNLTFNTNITKVNYTGKDLRDLSGKLSMKNQKLVFNSFKAQGMGGTMILNGNISTPIGKKPEFDIKYRMSKMKYEDMYKSVVSFKKLAPLAEFIHGIFNADFSFKGKFADGFMPDFTTITAKGLIHTINAYIKNYPGLNKLAAKLQVNSLNNMEIKDTKNSFEIENGTVIVNPFDYEFDNMKFNISGTNKLDKTIDYIVHAKIPKSKIKKIPGGTNLNKGLDFIISKAKSTGIDVQVGDIINLDIKVQGKYNKPKIGIKIAGTTKKGMKNTVDNTINNTKIEIKKEVENKKKEVKKKTHEAIDSTKKKLKKKAEEELKKQKEKAKKKIKDKLGDALKDLWK